jgi:DNA-binding MarR family transcriptional regulator
MGVNDTALRSDGSPGTVATPRKPTAGARAWNLMFEILRASKPYMETAAAEFDMTPQQLYALRNLGGERAVTMSEFATLLGCDASNVTAIADKLESRGLVERRSASNDRRVKALVLTPAGVEMYGRVNERMQQPPPAIGNLSEADQEALGDLLERALNAL